MSRRLVPAPSSILIVKTECDFASFASLWDLPPNHKDEDLQQLPLLIEEEISWWHQQIKEGFLKCDIILLPMVENDGISEGEDESHRNDVSMDLEEVAHGMVIFPHQSLFPCGNENLLNIENPKTRNYHLSLSDCMLDVSPALKLPLSVSKQRPDDDLQQQQQNQQTPPEEKSLMVAYTTHILMLVLPLDKSIQQAVLSERKKHSHRFNVSSSEKEGSPQKQQKALLSDQKANPPKTLSLNQCDCHIAADQPLRMVQKPARGDPFVEKQQFETMYHHQLQLLESRLHQELQSIQMITRIMVLLPGLALVAVGVWVFLDRQALQKTKKKPSSLLPNEEADQHVGRSSRCRENESPSSLSSLTGTPPSRSCAFSRQGCIESQGRHFASRQTNVSPSIPNVMSGQWHGERQDNSVGPRPSNETTRSLDSRKLASLPDAMVEQEENDSNKAVESTSNGNVLSPRSSWTQRWEKKKEEKNLKEKELAETIKTLSNGATKGKPDDSPPGMNATVITPESTPKTSILRSAPATNNLSQLMRPAATKQKTKKSRVMLSPEFGLSTTAEQNGPQQARPSKIETFVDSYW